MQSVAMDLTAGEIRSIAVEMAEEHGALARDYAARACAEFERLGIDDRAHFWRILSAMLDDIVAHHIDPDAPISLH